MWTDWPNRELDGLMKGYVLAQWAFWLQQIIVINIEDRRKDHWQMFSHHIITTALISSCYYYHFTRVGNMILVVMDVVDLFLPVRNGEAKQKEVCTVSCGILTCYRLPSVSSMPATAPSATSCLEFSWFHGF